MVGAELVVQGGPIIRRPESDPVGMSAAALGKNLDLVRLWGVRGKLKVRRVTAHV